MRHIPLLLACLAYVGFRSVVLWQAFDAVSVPTYELHNMGNLARMLSSEAPGPPIWMHFDNAGGQQLVAVLAAPLYTLFGDTYLSLKLVPFLMGLASLLLLWRIMRTEFGDLAANVAAWLYVLGPPTLTKYSLIASGNHFENTPFLLGAYALFLEVHRRGRRGPWLFALGTVLGFSLFVYPGAVVQALLFGVLHVALRGLRGTLRDLPAGLAGSLVGLAPLIAVNLIRFGRSVNAFAAPHMATTDATVLARLLDNLYATTTDVLPSATCFEDAGPLSASLAGSLYLGGFVAAWLVMLPALTRGLRGLWGTPAGDRHWAPVQAAPLLLYLPLFLLLIGLGRWDFDAYAAPVEVCQYRYFVPHFVLTAMLVGAAIAHLARAPGMVRRMAAAVLGSATLVTCLATLPIAKAWPGTEAAGLSYAGQHFPYYGMILMAETERDTEGNLVADREAIEAWLTGLPARDIMDVWAGIGYYTSATLFRSGKPLGEQMRSAIDLDGRYGTHPAAEQYALARGLGSALRSFANAPAPFHQILPRALARLETSTNPTAQAVVEGLSLEHGFVLSHHVPRQLELTFAIAPQIPEGLKPAFHRGLGVQLGRWLGRGIAADVTAVREVMRSLPQKRTRDAVGFGMGWGFSEHAPPNALAAALRDIDCVDLERSAMRGAGACQQHFDKTRRRDADALAEALTGLTDSQRAAWGRGRRWPNYPAPWAADGD